MRRRSRSSSIHAVRSAPDRPGGQSFSTPKASLVSQMSGIKKPFLDDDQGHDPWKKGEPMYKDGRSVPVVDAEDRALDVHNVPLNTDGLRRKKQEPLEKLMLITITKQDKSILIECIDSADGDKKFESAMKLPSLALVDTEAGLGFVQRVASKVRIQRDASGAETIRIR